MPEVDSALLLKFVGVVVRASIVSAGAVLVQKGYSNEAVLNEFAGATAQLIVGALATVFALMWSFMEKYTSAAKVRLLAETAAYKIVDAANVSKTLVDADAVKAENKVLDNAEEAKVIVENDAAVAVAVVAAAAAAAKGNP